MSIPIPSPVIPDTLRNLLSFAGYSGSGRELAGPVFILVTFLCWPIAACFRHIESPVIRKILAMVVGGICLFMIYGANVMGMFLLIIFCFYWVCRYRLLPASGVSILSIGILGFVHYEAMLNGTAMNRMSLTGTLMIMVVKICMFAYHVQDGHLWKTKKPLSVHEHVAQQRVATAIVEDVSLLDFLSYTFEFFGGIVGPVCTFNEFSNFMHLRGDFAELKSVSLRKPSLKAITKTLVFLGAYTYISTIPTLQIDTLVTEWFLKLPTAYMLVLCSVIVSAGRLVFCVAWSMSEVNYVLSGFGYQPPSRFGRGCNVAWRRMELAENMTQVTSNWNIRLAELWLKNCVYLRVEKVPTFLRKFISPKGLGNLLTKLTSAIWHGWFLGYQLAFLSLGLGNWTESVVRARLHPLLPNWLLHSRAFCVLAWLHTWLSVNFFFAPFLLLTAEKSLLFSSSFFWCVHLYHFGLILVLTLCTKRPLPRAQNEKAKKL